MIFEVPVHVEESEGFRVRPLFFELPEATRPTLAGALASFAGSLRKHLDAEGRSWRHDELAGLTFCPPLRDEVVSPRLELRRSSPELRVLVVSFQALDRRLALIPAVERLWFTVERGEVLSVRAAEVLEHHFRDLERRQGNDFHLPEGLLREARTRTWTDTVELRYDPPRKPSRLLRGGLPFMLLGGAPVKSGAEELERVGRCLDTRYPDGLARAVRREAEVAELDRLLEETRPEARRPVLLLGPSKVGKTAVLHERVGRQVERRGRQYGGKGLTWLLAPQRLVSGMSYAGQWEERLLAILREARRKGHVLYVDDPVGLYHAGLSASSSLSVGQVLRPFLERGEVKLVAEATPEVFRVLQETDRGLADLFQVLRVKEPDEETTLRVLIHTVRELEASARVRFAPEVIPAVLDSTRRFERQAALPGKAVDVLKRLATRHRKEEIGRDQVLAQLEEASGMSLHMLDPRREFSWEQLHADISAGMVGQDRAREATTDVVSVARARLDDPDRPLGVFLFLGPTGVGKTQCARALARALYGDAERLVRFDMNQYVDPLAVARLVGTPEAPEGLLTGALRRQPFSVILLDEVEKAHPAVYDLLLQALGEGRLTDARGRTADLTMSIVVMTSNLGVAEARDAIGLVAGERDPRSVYQRAAEDFFRPEFVNRLDHVLPFSRLERRDIERVAERLAREVLTRDGLVRRKALLEIDPAALARVVEEGYDAELGARALKRSLERCLALPVAAHLAVLDPGDPTVVQVGPAEEGLDVRVHALREVEAAPLATERIDEVARADLAEALRAALDRIGAALAGVLPEGEVVPGELAGNQLESLHLKEDLLRVAGRVEAAGRWLSHPDGPSPRGVRKGRVRGARRSLVGEAWSLGRVVFREAMAALDIRAYMEELAAHAPPPRSEERQRLIQVVRELAFLDLRVRRVVEPERERCELGYRGYGDVASWLAAEVEQVREALLGMGYWVSPRQEEAAGRTGRVRVEGPGARTLASLLEGSRLHMDREGCFRLVDLRVAAPAEAAAAPTPGPVLRLHEEGGSVLDLPTRAVFRHDAFDPLARRDVLLARLPLPVELEEVMPS